VAPDDTSPAPAARSLVAPLSLVFVLSGASALLFESVWFRLAGLALGNSVWATSLVLTGFMAGLGLGNLLALLRGGGLRRPVRAYAALEVVVGASGLAVVLLLPHLTRRLIPLLQDVVDDPWRLNPLRLLVALALLLVPTTAMGATLPLLVRALARRSGFGPALGFLYGANTLGATMGSLAAETVAVPLLGITGTGVAAAALNLVAAGLAWRMGQDLEIEDRGGEEARPAAAAPAAHRTRAVRLLACAFAAGALLLALEVVWFRFLLLYVLGTSPVFAAMLAVVLLGISAGGLAGGALLRARPHAYDLAPLVALGSALAVVVGYAGYATWLGNGASAFHFGVAAAVHLALPLMLPTCFLSGVLFTLLGRGIQEEVGGETRATGALTLANTLGAAAGSLGAGFLLLPGLGVEKTIFGVAAAYVGVAAAAWPGRARLSRSTLGERVGAGVVLAGALLAVCLFPFGLMDRFFIPRTAARFGIDGSRLVAFREGLTETVIYLENVVLGESAYHLMATNGVSMSGTMAYARRYMKLYVWWPTALHPAPRRALLISYGVGSTARALVDTRELEHIDIVDISRDVLAMSDIPIRRGAPHPLHDPRVQVHVEDGRFFLLGSRVQYDIITAEPPPPKSAGIVNLYSREYFQLMHDRLAEGGMATYWLPVFLLSPDDARTIMAAFCAAFPDCALWNGAGLDWMLTGSRGAQGPVSVEHFRRQWNDPVVGAELATLGFETPEQLGATFIGDARFLATLTEGTEPLTDDRPYRLSTDVRVGPADPWFTALLDPRPARDRFAQSELIRRLWPPDLREATLPWFDVQWVVNDAILQARSPRRLQELRFLLQHTLLQELPLWLLRTNPDTQWAIEQAAARGRTDATIDGERGLRALARRDVSGALTLLARARAQGLRTAPVDQGHVLALCLSGDGAAARALVAAPGFLGADDPAFVQWMQDSCGSEPAAVPGG
jgi:predicted membrane-bound spermidine synthase